MSASYIQWTDLSTSQDNKRRSAAILARQEDAGVDEQQRELLSYIQRAVEQERHRIAEDLHDSVAQDIALALHKLEHVQHLLEQSQLYQAFQEVTHIARILEDGLQNLRGSIDALLPQQCDKQTWFASLMTLIQEYQQEHPELQLDCRIEPRELLMHMPIPAELEVPIFRFVQQALNNIWQHASATHIVIALTLMSNVLTVEVCDNGDGFSFEHEGGNSHEEGKPLPHGTNLADDEISAQFGLRIMRERTERVGGTWRIKSQPGGGTCVHATFPLKGLG
jgi:signal transduction histidine kinase